MGYDLFDMLLLRDDSELSRMLSSDLADYLGFK